MTLEKLTRDELLMELKQFEKVARKYGWSEAVNCTPWTYLDGHIENLSLKLGHLEAHEALDPEEGQPSYPPPRPSAHILTRGLGTDIPPKRRR
jgi:hypothetical protein